MPKDIFRILIPAFLLIMILFVVSACETTAEAKPPAEYIGNWVGLGRTMISNEYMNQRQVPFMLIIEENGTVTGYVGDASIMKTKLNKPVWWLKLIGQKKYKASFTLSGNIANRESFHREGGTIHIDKMVDGELLCTFNSTGDQVSTNNLILTVKDIKLRKAE